MARSNIQKLELASVALMERELRGKRYEDVKEFSGRYDVYRKLILKILSPRNAQRYEISFVACYSPLNLIDELINYLPEIKGSEREKEGFKKLLQSDCEKIYEFKEALLEKDRKIKRRI